MDFSAFLYPIYFEWDYPQTILPSLGIGMRQVIVHTESTIVNEVYGL